MFAPPPTYIGQLHARLAQFKDYPFEARRNRREGTALLRFVIDRSGRVQSWKIERSTGSAILDAAVQRMIERADPLPPMPADLEASTLDLVVPIPFALR